MKDVAAILYELHQSEMLDLQPDNCIKFMLDCCALVGHLMSPTIREAFDTGRRYWQTKDVSKDELNAARVACWKDLDAMDPITPMNESGYLAGRAVICILFPEFPAKGESAHECISWCLDFVNRAEDHRPDQMRLLQHHFADVLHNEQ
jgi:hypothetical protein